MNNPVHPKLMEEIAKNLDIGITSVGIMSRALKCYVQENFEDANPADSRYYPSRVVLSNAMYQVRNRLRYSKIDELNVEHMVSCHSFEMYCPAIPRCFQYFTCRENTLYAIMMIIG